MKKRILFINGHMNVGGVEKSLLDILKNMDYDRYDVELLLFEDYGDYAPEIPSQVKVRLFDLHDTYGSLPKALLRCVKSGNWKCFRMRLIMQLAKLFDARQYKRAKRLLFDGEIYDAVVAFRPGICTSVAAFAADGKNKITWWHHGEYNLSGTAERDYCLACEKVNTIAVVSQSCRMMLAQKLPMLADKLIVIPNMIPVDDIVRKSAQSVSYDEGTTTIVSVGRLAPEKHFENAVFAAKQLKAHGMMDFRWYIVGEGAERSYLEQRIAEEGVADTVMLTGSRANPYPYMAHATLFAHPSYVESQGLVVLEAMALGVPCVVTKSLGPCEFIRDGVNALLTEQSAASLAAAVERLLTDRELYDRMKKNTKCPEQFQIASVMGRVEKALEAIV